MAAFSQEQRLLKVTTPLGADALLVERFSGHEGVSQPFSFRLDLLAPQSVSFEKILGQAATLGVEPHSTAPRFINGIISEYAQGHQVPGARGPATFIRYRATLVPRFWLLTQRQQCRIWQGVSVPQILHQLLVGEWGLRVSPQLTGSYAPRNYCVQYRESDFDFASRLMEEEGIAYYFQHQEGSHTLVLADNLHGSQPALPGSSGLIFDPEEGRELASGRITAWEKQQRVRPCRVTLRDHCFELPTQSLEASSAISPSATAGTVQHTLVAGPGSQLESYDYPGNYAHHFDGVSPAGGDQSGQLPQIFDVNRRVAMVRIEAEAALALRIEGASTYPQLTPGYVFQLQRHFDGDGSYRVLRVEHEGSIEGAYQSGDGSPRMVYRNDFTCLPADLTYRPERTTPRPRVGGSQTATVVGTGPVFCDKYGRIKVQFHWDRLGQNNANSSCWLRVAQTWAGQGYGMIAVPRVGQEVIVDFLEGDPDRPIVVGSVFNAQQVPPFPLPGKVNLHTLKSQSINGGAGNYSGLAISDLLGAELIHLHSEKDMLVSAENNKQETVAASQLVQIGQDHAVQIGSNHTVAVGGNQSTAVAANQVSVTGGNHTEAVSGVHSHMVGNMYQLTVGGGSAPSPPAPPSSLTQNIFEVPSSSPPGAATYSASTGAFITTVYGLSTNNFYGLYTANFLGGCIQSTEGYNITMNFGRQSTVTVGMITEATLASKQEFSALGKTVVSPEPIQQLSTSTVTISGDAGVGIYAGAWMEVIVADMFSVDAGSVDFLSGTIISMAAGEAITFAASELISLSAPEISLASAGNIALMAGASTISLSDGGIILECGASMLMITPDGIVLIAPSVSIVEG